MPGRNIPFYPGLWLTNILYPFKYAWGREDWGVIVLFFSCSCCVFLSCISVLCTALGSTDEGWYTSLINDNNVFGAREEGEFFHHWTSLEHMSQGVAQQWGIWAHLDLAEVLHEVALVWIFGARAKR
ncbi:Hypothetical predicted protein [Podarcis lilfordi]|uniref:Uncharacterized protein n=1 Tax=Podarcis lilfordi TaxID=74358 RepID=A0AA35KW88_9SAUR|nr:Hypothetical predicted protein [Podarcis lilfordi]